MNKLGSDVLIGDLLRGAGLVKVSDMTNAVQVAGKTGLPVGRVLVMLGLVTSEVVQAALNAQSMIREHIITLEAGRKALCVVSANRVTIEKALEIVGGGISTPEPTNKLGNLLQVSNLVTPEQLMDALNTSQHLGLPLGRILVLKGILSDEQVESALDLQALLRDGRINRLEALEALRSLKNFGSSILESLSQLGCSRAAIERNKVRIGELALLADLVSESDLLTALEIGIVENIQIGQVLIEFGFITDDILNSALRLQKMVGNDHLTIEQAGQALKLTAQENFSLVEAVSEVMEPKVLTNELISLLQMLQLSGLISRDDYTRLMMFKETSIFEVVLVGTGLMSETTLQVAVRCHMLVNEGLLTMEQAVVVLHHWRWTGISLNDVLKTMGWADGRRPELVPGIYHWEPAAPAILQQQDLDMLTNDMSFVNTCLDSESSINSVCSSSTSRSLLREIDLTNDVTPGRLLDRNHNINIETKNVERKKSEIDSESCEILDAESEFDLSITSSLANFEWQIPQVNQSWH